ncbi:MAG: enolase C-terminal domain-like protein, partial [Chthoniobacteraceae bacterium]
MNLHCATRELHPRHAFRISRARRTEVRNVFVRLDRDGLAGYGEASPNSFYGETWEGVMAKLEDARDFLSALEVRSVAEIEIAWNDLWRFLAPSRAAQCAVDVALWDWLARREGVSVGELAWGTRPKPVRTFCTIGLSNDQELLEKADELVGFPMIKIKADATADLRAVRFARERFHSALLAVDANCAWSDVDLSAVSRELARLDVAFVEQPFPP